MEQKDHGGKKRRGGKRHNNKQSESLMEMQKIPRPLVQPMQSWTAFEDPPTEDVGKDFQSLMNAPITEGGHFVFKSEKSWTVDVSEHFKYFTLDLKVLSAAIHSIPFDEYMNIEAKYLTDDQQISIQNTADVGKKLYEETLNNATTLNSETMQHTGTENEKEKNVSEKDTIVEDLQKVTLQETRDSDNSDNSDIEEDLNILLSLKEPVKSSPVAIVPPVISSQTDELKISSKNKPNKPIDLEKWLDSVLDD